jgi:Ca2+-binding RTX toxin-like protein
VCSTTRTDFFLSRIPSFYTPDRNTASLGGLETAMSVSKATALLVATFAILGGPAAVTADASTLRIAAGKVRYVAGNEANRVQVVRGAEGEFNVFDPSTRIRVSTGCRSITRTSAVCSGAITGVSITARGGNDRLDVTFLDIPASLDGGDGNDVLIGGGAGDLLDADDGNDSLFGGGGADELRGDPGVDHLLGGAGPDVIDGGTGDDTADYSDATGPLSIDLDGNADDGHSGEGDRVEADVERVVGGPFDDRIAAISGDHVLIGGGGNDTLAGGSGTDRLEGGDGDDRLNGGVGSDALDGGDGSDLADYAGRFDPVDLDLRAGVATTDRGSGTRRVRETDNLFSIESARGSSHADVLRGGPGPNVLAGGPGDDVLDGGAGPDALVGNSGRDRADYSGRRAPLTVTLDGVANDGAGGENDFVHDSTEDLAGGARGDQLTGNDRRNVLLGGGGRDVLVGLGGGDTLHGGDGADRVDGGDGADALVGEAGLDLLLGGPGADRTDARDGRRDGVECGDGRDFVWADRVDRVQADCERERR